MKEVKRLTMGLILSWFFGCAIVIGGIGIMVQESFLAGLFSVLIGALIIPTTTKVLREKMHLEFSTGVKVFLVIVLLILASLFMPR